MQSFRLVVLFVLSGGGGYFLYRRHAKKKAKALSRPKPVESAVSVHKRSLESWRRSPKKGEKSKVGSPATSNPKTAVAAKEPPPKPNKSDKPEQPKEEQRGTEQIKPNDNTAEHDGDGADRRAAPKKTLADDMDLQIQFIKFRKFRIL